MITTSLLNQVVCFRFPPSHREDEPHPLHKTKGTIKLVYLHDSSPMYAVITEQGSLETCRSHQIVVCFNITFEDAVKIIEKEDAER